MSRNRASKPRISILCINQNAFTLRLFCLWQVLSQGADLPRDRDACLPVCTSVHMRSLSSRPRTLLRLISYSVAGYSLVMVNSVTVLGTTELSSRPTKEEQRPQLKFCSSLINAVHGTVYMGAPSSTTMKLGCAPDSAFSGEGKEGSWTGNVGA